MVTLVSGSSAIAQTATQPTDVASPQSETLPASPAGAPEVGTDMTSDQLVDAGTSAVMSGKLDDARRILLAAIARNGRNLRALSTLAFAYERSAEQLRSEGSGTQSTAQADRFIDQAVDVYLTAGGVAIDQDQLSVAEQFYDRILLHRPGSAKALLGLARIYAATDRHLQAVDRYRDYLASPEGKNDAKAYIELAELYLDGTHWRLAMDLLARAQKIQPDDPDVDMMLARAYQNGNQMADAMESAKKAKDKAPDKTEVPQSSGGTVSCSR